MSSATESLRVRLLRDTLDLAAERSPFYREHLAGLAAGVTGLGDLPLLPTTTKQDLASRGDEMLTSREFPAVVGFTSGTSFRDTPAPPAIPMRSRSDLDALAALGRDTDDDPGAERPLAVDIITSIHGARGAPAAPGCFLLPLEKPFHLANLRSWLTRRFDYDGFSERVQYLAGPLNLVRLLAVALEETAPETLDDLSLVGVFTHGDHLTRRWREQLETLLGATVVDVYGLAEIAGGTAMECPGCGCFHMPPIVIPEIVGVADGEPADEIGELVLTALAPFQTLQPLIRYRTGDAVLRGPACPLVDDLGFRVVGRITDRSPDAAELALLLPTHLVRELLDDTPEVARLPYARLADFGVGPVYGSPLYGLQATGPRAARLDVELAFSPRRFAEQADAVRDRIEHSLREIARRPVELDVRVAAVPAAPALPSAPLDKAPA